jgi:hypothetical protein
VSRRSPYRIELTPDERSALERRARRLTRAGPDPNETAVDPSGWSGLGRGCWGSRGATIRRFVRRGVVSPEVRSSLPVARVSAHTSGATAKRASDQPIQGNV